MEVKAYLRILLRRWWLIVLGFSLVFSGAGYWTAQQPTIYEAQATFVMRPRSEFIVDDEFVRALDVVSRRVEINTTFAEVAGSKLIRNRALATLDLTPAQRQGLSVSGRVIGGTNILEVTTRGRDPEAVSAFANAIGGQTVDYVGSLYDVFELEPLDEARTPRSPVSPRPALNLGLGAIFGVALGVAMALLLEYLKTPHHERDSFNILDRETGAYTRSYLTHRMTQEISRSRRKRYPLGLGLIKVEIGETEVHNVQSRQIEALRIVRMLSEPLLRPEDVLARFDDETLAILLPDMTEEEAHQVMRELDSTLAAVPAEAGGRGDALLMRSTVSAIAYDDSQVMIRQFMQQAAQTLDDVAAINGRRPVMLSKTGQE